MDEKPAEEQVEEPAEEPAEFPPVEEAESVPVAFRNETPVAAEVTANESNLPVELVSYLDAVIKLFDCLKKLTESLSQKDRDNYLHSKVSESMDSVIDDLKNLSASGDRDGN